MELAYSNRVLTRAGSRFSLPNCSLMMFPIGSDDVSLHVASPTPSRVYTPTVILYPTGSCRRPVSIASAKGVSLSLSLSQENGHQSWEQLSRPSIENWVIFTTPNRGRIVKINNNNTGDITGASGLLSVARLYFSSGSTQVVKIPPEKKQKKTCCSFLFQVQSDAHHKRNTQGVSIYSNGAVLSMQIQRVLEFSFFFDSELIDREEEFSQTI